MKRFVLTDALIRDALAPDLRVSAPAGLLAQITAGVARTPQRRTLRLSGLPQSRRLAWVAVAAATMVALAGALLLAGGGPNPFQAFLPPAPSPLPSAVPSPLAVGSTVAATEIAGVSTDEAWATVMGDPSDTLWHRTAAGWSGPIEVDPSGTGAIWDIDRLADGRIVVGADNGIYVGNEAGWTHVAKGTGVAMAPVFGVAADAAGTIWAPGNGGLRSLREVEASWQLEWHMGCPASGLLVAPAADGSVWTAGIEYSGAGGIARLGDGACTQLFPYGDGRAHDVQGIAADTQGRVAMVVKDTAVNEAWPGGRLVVWEDGRWTTLREGETFKDNAWNALSYAPDGALWAAFDNQLWRYEGTAGTPVRDAMSAAVSVAPDGTVWFVAKDATGVGGVVERLLPGDVQAEPSPAPAEASSLVQELTVGLSGGSRLHAVSADRAWVAMPGSGDEYELWNRTSDGWRGPMRIGGAAVIRGIEDLGDGRLAVARDDGVWLGNEAAWTRIWGEQANAVKMDPDGVLWVAGLGDRGTSSLRSLREEAGGQWTLVSSGCTAGGWSLDIASDGSVWTSGIGYSGTAGIARWAGGTCEQVAPLPDANATDVPAIAAGPSGRLAALVMNVECCDRWTGAHLMEWDGERWSEIDAEDATDANRFGGIGFDTLAFSDDGAIWAIVAGTLSRYANGAWASVAEVGLNSPISVAPDGTVWYVAPDGTVGHLQPVGLDSVLRRGLSQYVSELERWQPVASTTPRVP